jgi:hypothetical protein
MRPSAPLLLCFAVTTAHAEEATAPGGVDPSVASRWELSAAAGVSNIEFGIPGMFVMGTSARSTEPMGATPHSQFEPNALFALRYRITERLTWSVPTLSFAYAGGNAGEREWIPWGGLTSWGAGYSSIEGFIADGQLGAGIGLREWLGGDTSLNLTTSATSAFNYTSQRHCIGASCPSWAGPTTWIASATGGVSRRLGDALTVNLGVGISRIVAANDPMDVGTQRVSFGSVQDIGLRRLPLIEAQLNRNWSLDGYAAAAYVPSTSRLEQHYLVGFTRRWLASTPRGHRQD